MGFGGNAKLCCDYIKLMIMVELLVIVSTLIEITRGASTTNKDMSTANLIRVDQSGKGDFTKIQEAIDSVPSNNSHLYFIWVKPGTYREKIVVPSDKPFVTLSGTKSSNTIITWNDNGDIFDSPTLSVLASNFVGRFLTIQNTFGAGRKAVSVRVSGDKAAFYNCRILSYQDTLLDDSGRHYFNNCYIEGAVDFIFGSAASLFEKCHVHSLSERDGAITAHRRDSSAEKTGFIFLGGKISGDGGCFLGRPWGSFSRVVFAYTYMSNLIIPQGWNDWGDQSTHSTVYYGEYKCYGPGANRSKRVGWSRSLTSDEAASYLTKDMIGGRDWLRPSPTRFKTPSAIISAKDLNNE
ncbi:putative pectinesterase 11 [Cannabis sativa]|uniref:putative pectinesterase 11 n=1 Tax=Cannabis sativa TaxID=3483 RepID=UPI0029CA177E|nr:putative pectinesterase 11 [Cannabis sativa]